MDLRIDWLGVAPATSTTGGKWVKVSTSTLRTLSVRATPLWRTALPAPRPRGLSSTGVRAGLPKPGSARGVADTTASSTGYISTTSMSRPSTAARRVFEMVGFGISDEFGTLADVKEAVEEGQQ